jgi:hypothetical protein
MSSLSLFTHVPLMLQGALRIMRQLRSERRELDHVAPPRTKSQSEWYDRPVPLDARGSSRAMYVPEE